MELILENDFEKAGLTYRALKEQDAGGPAASDDHINDSGYLFYHEERMELSQNTFKVNIVLCPIVGSN